MDIPILRGRFIKLEPLALDHTDVLAEASAGNEALYRWTPVPQGKTAAINYIQTAIAMRDAGTSIPFAIIDKENGLFKGSTRFWNMEYWPWPKGHPRFANKAP